MDDGVGRLLEFLRADEKRGLLCNLTDAWGLSNQLLLDLYQLRPTYAYRTKSEKWQICLSIILPCLYSDACHKSYTVVHGHPQAPVIESTN